MGDDETSLMEPSLFRAQRFGEPAFPGPSLELDGEQAGDYVDDYNSDEDRLIALKHASLEFTAGASAGASAGAATRSSTGSFSSTSSRDSWTSGILPASASVAAAAAMDGHSFAESASLLAIEAQYR